MPKDAKRSKGIVGVLWICVILFSLQVWRQSGVHVTEVPDLLLVWLQEFGLLNAAIIYIILYAIRPITLFPATWLTVASGLIFGPWFGVLFTIIGSNISANVAFALARYLGRDWVQSKETGIVKKWDARLSQNSIVTVMIMRFLYLPFDGVNFGCGLTTMKHRDFAVGTFIGMLPASITFVLLGGVLSPHSSGMVMIMGLDMSERLFVLLLSAFFFVLGLLIAHLIRVFQPETCKV